MHPLFRKSSLILPNKIPPLFFWGVIFISILPFLLNVLGIHFGTAGAVFDPEKAIQGTRVDLIEQMFHALSGAFTHTILEWSAFSTAIFVVLLAFIHFYLKRDVTTPVIGVALFCAGSMDAFHTLAADRLIEVVADSRNLIPFTWAICRVFNALIILTGVSVFLLRKEKQQQHGVPFVLTVSLIFGLIAYGIIYFSATRTNLPQTMYPDSLVTRPYDVLPLILYIFAGTWVLPRFYKAFPSMFSHALMLSMVPQIATQLHMSFGSTSLFDNHFNIAHFLKILAYFVPFLGLIFDYIQTYQIQQKTVMVLEKTEKELREKSVVMQSEMEKRQTIEKRDLVKQEELEKLNWIKTSDAELNNTMRGEQELEELGRHILHCLTTLLDAKIGAFYIIHENHLTMISSYAYTETKKMTDQFELGEGLVGQAALEKHPILMTNVPEDYLTIGSGVGEAPPQNILLLPILYEDGVIGVVELGTFYEFTELQMEFLNQAVESIGISFHSAQSRLRMKALLEETQSLAEELQTQQEELRQANEELEEKSEELQQQQEELRQANEELEEKANMLEHQQHAI